jgi:hypothetical protein
MKKSFSVILILLMILSIPTFAFADSEITVTGTGEVLIPADVAVVSLGISAADPEVLTAQAKANQAIASIRDALIAFGIAEEDINTDYINIYALYDYSGDEEAIKSYKANSTLAIRVAEIEKVGGVIDTAFGAGANTLNGISFSASDTKDAQEKAMRAAVEDARAKAEIFADAAGLQIRGVEDIVEQGAVSYDRGAVNSFKAADAAVAGTFVQSAKLSVTSTVSITFKADW